MSTLIAEAERRFLGAMLNDRSIELHEVVNAADFSNPAYGAVYSAIGYARAGTYLDGPELSAQVAKLADVPGINQPVLELMRAEAPNNRDHIAAYATMITDASFTRRINELAQRTLQGDQTALSPEHLRELALLERHGREALESYERNYDTSGTTRPAPEPGSRAALEEQLVASLMANPEQVRTLVEITPPETLQDFRSRTVYELAASMAWNRDEPSDLDLLYQLDKAEKFLVNSGHDRPDYPDPDAAYLKRLRETPTYEHTGTDAARAIAAQDARTRPEQQAGPSPYGLELDPSPTVDLGTQPHQAGPQSGIEGGPR